MEVAKHQILCNEQNKIHTRTKQQECMDGNVKKNAKKKKKIDHRSFQILADH